jgi:hypothetical protein
MQAVLNPASDMIPDRTPGACKKIIINRGNSVKCAPPAGFAFLGKMVADPVDVTAKQRIPLPDGDQDIVKCSIARRLRM